MTSPTLDWLLNSSDETGSRDLEQITSRASPRDQAEPNRRRTIRAGGNTIAASAGDFVYLPRGIAHSFNNTGDGCANAVVLITPARLEGFFADVFELAADRSAPPPASKELIGRALAAGPRHGLGLLPPV